MAQISLNIPLIRNGTPKELVSYLDELRQSHSDVSVCQSLFEAVDHEYLSPLIFNAFIPRVSCLDAIVLCIHRGPSRVIRKQGIKQFGKELAKLEQWESAWRAIGGTNGLIDLFARVSVAEVKELARAIGSCHRPHHKAAARERAIEGLLHALLPSHYPGSKLQTHDKRPITHHYARMVPACSVEFVKELLDAKDQSNPLYEHLSSGRLIKTHGELLQKRVFDGIFGPGKEDVHISQYLEAFVYSQPPKPSPNSNVSVSMAFATKMLQSRLEDIKNDKRWPSQVSEAEVLFSLLNRSLKKRLPETKLRDVIMLGLKLLEAKPGLKSTFQSKGMWLKLSTRWKRAPELYEDSITLALRLQLGGSQTTIGEDFLSTSKTIRLKQELRWPLLRLYCLHVPKKAVDLNADNDFTPLAKQRWPSDVFYQLSKDQAVRLLKGLHRANPGYSFLQAPAKTTILDNQGITSQKNFNAVLLLTLLQRSSEEIQMRAKSAVDELRKKSATAREQPDRAKLAISASAYAIASGSLDLYGETITWQQRFVRDPISVKMIFAHDAVMTAEGIELLSGIPKPLPDGITLGEVALSVEKANKILKTFHESMLIAKREPSFQKRDWGDVTSLFGAAISLRVERAAALQKHLRDSESDVYTAIWDGTLTMLGNVDVAFLKQSYQLIKRLLSALPPTSLAATSKAMLDAGNEVRMRKDRQSGDDTIELLSYELLLQLTKSEKPELAQQLVLRTILDRPDASSWHRLFLSVPFMKSLSAKDAHQMLLAFATAIGEKLEEQSYVKVGEAQPPKSAPPASLVKVTTVKHLAQLLDNAEFISADAAVEVLVELFKAGTHRDIRLATLGSLLSLLNNLCSGADENWRSNSLVEKIMEALETVIPIVGSINERRPLRQEDWMEARETGSLPDVSDISDGLPPLLSATFTAACSPQYPGLKKLRAEFVTRYLLPALGLSQTEHQKWVALFLVKHKANLAVDDLPPTPVTPKVWEVLVGNYLELIPTMVLDDFNKHIVMTIAPSADLRDFNKTLRKNVDLCNTPEVQHWLSVFGQSMDQYRTSGTQTLVSMIHNAKPIPLVRNGITFDKVLDKVLMHASLFLTEYENYTDIWSGFVNNLRPPTWFTYRHQGADSMRAASSAWTTTGRLVLEKVTVLVSDKRKKNIRERKLSLLPSTTKLRLWLLPYPCFPDTTKVDHQCKTFANEMVELLDDFLAPEANLMRWHVIAEDACTVSDFLNTAEEQLRVALYIGKLTGSSDGAGDLRSSALNFVRIAVAMKLIGQGREILEKPSKGALSEDVVRGVVNMVEEWQNHFDEGIREKVAEWRRAQSGLWKILMSRD
ncbi:hypothetical protein V501_07832 [Pseudogymnoascus sp. VKM F-4519 (FW-2642)]|nr:hypothetical protein V501_07832 [Pseudogymnoascus sp. VKM F-4519 (FW-2642)]